MIGIPCLSASFAHSIIAVIWGTPIPVTTLVVQIDPGPIPTLTQSAPASIKSLVASAVATLPAIIWRSGKASFNFLTAFKTPLEWPWAVSIVTTSTFASTKAWHLSIISLVIPTAAPTNNLPCESLAEFGYCIVFSTSFVVIRPFNLKFSSTIGSFSILAFIIFSKASSIDMFSWPVINPSLVITSPIGSCSSFTNLTSLLVRIPTKVISSLTIGTPLIL